MRRPLFCWCYNMSVRISSGSVFRYLPGKHMGGLLMLRGNGALQAGHKFSKLSLTGFILSFLSLICFVWLLIASDRFRNNNVAVVIGTAAVGVSLTLSLIFSVAGFISARKSKSKGGPFGLTGVIMSSIMAVVLVILLLTRSMLSGIMAAWTSPGKDVPLDTDSAVIDGVPKIFGEAIFLPCTVAELKQKGFDTDYELLSQTLHMWPKDDRESYFNGPYFDCYLEYGSYDYKNNKASDDSVVVAITFQEYNQVDLDFHNISFDTTDGDIWDMFGTPAYQEDDLMNGHAAYFLGDHGLVYKFSYSFSNQRPESDQNRGIWEITIAAKEMYEI